MRRILDDPARLKRCTRCGIEKPLSAYSCNSHGLPKSQCKPCRNALERTRYATAPNREKGGNWSGRQLDAGSSVRICRCHGKTCWIWLDDDTIRCAQTGRRLERFRVEASA